METWRPIHESLRIAHDNRTSLLEKNTFRINLCELFSFGTEEPPLLHSQGKHLPEWVEWLRSSGGDSISRGMKH